MKVLHLTTFLQGGAGRVIASLALRQRQAGHDVRVVASATGVPGYGNYPDHLDALRRGGVPVDLVDSTFVREHAANLAVVRALDRIYPAGAEPDVIHTHAAVPSLVGLVFTGSRRSATAIVQTMHGWGIAKTPAQAASDVAVMNLVDRVAVLSRHAAGQLTTLGVEPSRIVRVSGGVSEAAAALGPRDGQLARAMRAARSTGRIVLATVGTIGARKNQAAIVEALARLANPRAFLAVIIGDGDTAALRSEIRFRRLDDVVRVHGFTPAARRIAREADVLLLPSRSEGQPLSVLEAFADGIPAIVSRVPEMAELVEDGRTGWLVDAEDAAALGWTLTGLRLQSADARRAMGQAAREVWQAHYTVEHMVDRYAALYQDAGPARPGRVAA